MPYKKILILDTGKEWGGGTNSLLELLKRIDKGKYHFTALFYNNYKKGSESDIKTEIERLRIDFIVVDNKKQPMLAKVLKEIGRLLLFPTNKLKRRYLFLIEHYFRIRPNAEKIAKVLNRLKIDLLYMNNQPSSNLEGIMAARDVNIPCIQHSRIGAELNSVEVNAVNNWLTRMICVSQGVKEMFVAQGVDASKCSVVYNGIAPDTKPAISASEIRKTWGVGEGEILIGTVGSLIKRKRINDLIEALANLQFQNSGEKTTPIHPPLSKGGEWGLKCMIVGDGPERESLRREVVEKGLQGNVIFTGFQSDAISYINAMDIFALPSENEGLPRVILEAMLMAKPVIACDVTGSAELVVDGETGFLVSVKNPEMLADALSKLIASGDMRNQMGKNARKMVFEKFSMDAYVSGVSKIFEEVIG